MSSGGRKLLFLRGKREQVIPLIGKKAVIRGKTLNNVCWKGRRMHNDGNEGRRNLEEGKKGKKTQRIRELPQKGEKEDPSGFSQTLGGLFSEEGERDHKPTTKKGKGKKHTFR